MDEVGNLHPQHAVNFPQLPPAEGWQESAEQQEMRAQIFGAPPKLIVRFYVSAERDPTETEKAGAPVYREKVRALIQVPGEKDCITVDVTEEHAQRYPREWELFQRSSLKPRAIPLESLPKMRPNIKAALAELNVNSVQELVAADVPEYLKPWRAWAIQINNLHDFANGKPKPRLKLVDGEMVAA
jgi:hypothetical protein